MTSFDLSTLPEPALLEGLDYERLLARRKQTLVDLVPETMRAELTAYLALESEPLTAALEESAYEEIMLRNRVNQLYRARLLYFAVGAELDHVAEESGVVRLEGEDDASLRTRVRLKNRGSSSAGPDDWWRFHAMSVSPLVEDVAVSRPGARGHIRLSILARTPSGQADADLLAAVLAYVSSDAVRNVAASVDVEPAARIRQDISAQVWLLPTALPGTFEGLEARLRQAFAEQRAIGWDLTPSWIAAQLHTSGVQRVDLLEPNAPLAIASDEAVSLGAVTLILMGRAY